MPIVLPHHFNPRSYQARVFRALQQGYKRIVTVQHRRSGKTKGSVNIAATQMMRRVGTYAHVFPEVKQAREVVWEGIDSSGLPYLEHFPRELMYKPPNRSEMSITFKHPEDPSKPGSRYILLGTDRNANALVGMNPCFIIWDEYSLQNPLARELCRPIMRENKGIELFAFTPRGMNHAHDLYTHALSDDDWYTEYLTVNDTLRDALGENNTPVITDDDIQRDINEGADLELIEQEYYLSWRSPMPGAYYAQELRQADQEGRISKAYYDNTRPVITGWDFGTSKAHDTNSVWFIQLEGNEVKVIDYYQASNEGVPHFVDMLEQKGYRYRCHFAMVKDLDEADWGQGLTRVEHFRRHGVDFTAVPKLPISDGVDIVRSTLSRCVFDEEKTRPGLNGLRSYRREWDEKNRIYKPNPVHDFASHPADAFRYLCLGIANPGQMDRIEKRRERAEAVQTGEVVFREDFAGLGWMSG